MDKNKLEILEEIRNTTNELEYLQKCRCEYIDAIEEMKVNIEKGCYVKRDALSDIIQVWSKFIPMEDVLNLLKKGLNNIEYQMKELEKTLIDLVVNQLPNSL